MIAAPIIIMIMARATIPYITVLFEAKPLTGGAVGAIVPAGESAANAVSALDP